MSIDDFMENVIKNDIDVVKNSFKEEYMYQFGRNGFTAFLQACQLGYTDMVKFFLQKEVNTEMTTSAGLNGLHWAASEGHDDVVLLLLENGLDKESETNKKFRPLHSAAVSDRDKTVRLLLAQGCDYRATNKDGKTAMDISVSMDNKKCVSILKKWTEYDKIFDIARQNRLNDFTEAFLRERINVKEKNTGMTVFDVVVDTKSIDCLEFILLQDLEENVVFESLKFTLKTLKMSLDSFKAQFRLYRSIIFDLKEKFEEYCTVEVVNSPWVLSGESFLDSCVKFQRKHMLDYTLQTLLEQKKTLNIAMEIARIKKYLKIRDVILRRKVFLDASDKSAYSRLLIAIQDNRVDVVNFILKKNLVDANECHHLVGSPLFFALKLRYGECVRALLDHGVNVNTVNENKQTPLHIALLYGLTQYNASIIERTNNVDEKDGFGYTPLHYAAINKDNDTCRILLVKGANLVAPIKIRQGDNRFASAFFPLCDVENPLTLCLKLHKTILPSLLDRISAQIANTLFDDGSTILHLSAKLHLSDVCGNLIGRGANVNVQNHDLNTALHFLFIDQPQEPWKKEEFQKTLNILIVQGTDINLRNDAGVSSFRYAFETGDKNTLRVIMSRDAKVHCEIEDFVTLFNRTWLEELTKLLSLQDVDFVRGLVLYSIEQRMEELVNCILTSVDKNIVQSIIEGALFSAVTTDNEAIFDRLVSMKLLNVAHFPTGETLLTRLIIEKSEKYSLKLAKSDLGEMYLDVANERGLTPLYLAADNGYLKLCKYLILESHNLEDKDAEGETAMERLFKSSTNTTDRDILKKIENLVKTMIRAGMDVNRVNKVRQPAISFCQNDALKHNLVAFQEKTNVKRPPVCSLEVDEDRNTCDICLSAPIDCQFGCGHALCRSCADQVDLCPKCRRPKGKIFPLYL